MHLFTAILLSLLRSALIVGALMALLFVGNLLFSQAGPTIREILEAPERLEALQTATMENVEAVSMARAEQVAHRARQTALEYRISQERATLESRYREDVAAIEEASSQQTQRVREGIEKNRQAVSDSIRRLEEEYCTSWNPIDWWTCRAVRKRAEEFNAGAARQRQFVENAVQRFEAQALGEIEARAEVLAQEFSERTQELQEQLQSSLLAIEDLERHRQELQDRRLEIQAEEAMIRQANWLWLEFRNRWTYLLFLALLIFLAPFLRRTIWYFLGMPLVSRARPIQLSPEVKTGRVQTSKSERTLTVELPPGRRLLARPGYIQSDRQGAKSELFFDRKAPNLSYLSGLVLLTRLDGQEQQGPDVSLDSPDSPESEETRGSSTVRKVMLGTPDDPDAYLMRIDLEDHPGIVLRASHVVALIGDIKIRSTWRLKNLHAWATSQVRFIVFSGTGTLVLEGYGDVHGVSIEEGREEKRMPLVLGFDTRLTYQTRRSATFLPYLVDPEREPLVVDVFEGTGTVFFEKNPTARTRHRTAGEAIAGFFLDAIRKLLGL